MAVMGAVTVVCLGEQAQAQEQEQEQEQRGSALEGCWKVYSVTAQRWLRPVFWRMIGKERTGEQDKRKQEGERTRERESERAGERESWRARDRHPQGIKDPRSTSVAALPWAALGCLSAYFGVGDGERGAAQRGRACKSPIHFPRPSDCTCVKLPQSTRCHAAGASTLAISIVL